ncbi:hypothetical protein B5M09_012245, partial [Aphanomyces astaci]
MAVRHLGQQVRQAVDAQGALIDSVQQAVGAQTQQTYELLMVLHQQQQVQAREMEMNQRLMAELVDQRDCQQILMDQLSAQRATAEHHTQGLRASAVASVQQSDALEEMRRRTSEPWTEDDWRTYFLGARECDPVDMTKLCQNMSKLKMDRSIQSAESRVSKLVSDFEAILVRLSIEGFAESEPKLTVDFLMAAITPPVVQKRVKELMKKDARAFKTWLSEYMPRYGEFEPLVQAFPAPPKTVDPPKGDPKPRKQKVVAVINVHKVPLTNFIPANGKSVCFKCLNPDHGVFQCTKCAPGEAQLLMNRAKVVWAEARTNAKPVSVVTKVVQPNEDSAVMCAARVVCTASQAVALDASFDSGADQSVMPPSTLRMLQDAGRDVVVTDLPAPVVVRGFVGPSHTVTQEVKLDLKFDTDAGPLMLTNVKCWLSLGNLPHGVGDILLSRPIMYKLGYDPHSMLREAAAVCSEYDMANVESTSGVVKAVMLATKQELTDDLAEEEEALVPMELAACFPDMTPVDPKVEQAKVQLILDTRVADA